MRELSVDPVDHCSCAKTFATPCLVHQLGQKGIMLHTTLSNSLAHHEAFLCQQKGGEGKLKDLVSGVPFALCCPGCTGFYMYEPKKVLACSSCLQKQ